MNTIKNILAVIHKLDAFHADYLIEKGKAKSSDDFIVCLNPDHKETKPSAKLFGSRPGLLHCFGCKKNYSILDTYSLLEGTPAPGYPGWIEKTLIPLAKYYGIQIELKELTPLEEQIYRAFRINADIEYFLVTEKFSPEVKKHLTERGWTEEFCRQHGIGSISSLQNLRAYLKEKDWSDKDLIEAHIEQKDLFGPTCLTFSIKDHLGNVVGFNSKNLKYDPNDPLSSRYVLSPNGVVFKKRELLYGLEDYFVDLQRHKRTKLYLVEGSADRTTCIFNNLDGVIALNGSVLTAEHCSLLREAGLKELILVLDGDKAGQEATYKIIYEMSSELQGIQVKVIELQNSLDPDAYFKDHTLEDFLKLPIKTAFQWRLEQYDKDTDPYAIAEEMAKIIAGTDCSPLQTDKDVSILSEFTNIEKRAILEQIEEIRSSEVSQNKEKAESEARNTATKILKNPEKARELATSLIDVLERLDMSIVDNRYGFEELSSFIDHQKQLEETTDGGFQGFVLPTKPILQNILYGNWTSETTVLIGGDPNVGKSNFLVDLTVDILTGNDGNLKDPYGKQTNKTIVFYHTIDDSRTKILNRILTNLSANYCASATMNMIANPKHSNHIKGLAEARQKAYEIVKRWVEEGRLLLKGVEQSKSLDFAATQLKKIRNRYHPDEYKVVYILDNLSKSERENTREDHVVMTELSEKFKDLAVLYKAACLGTVEYRKRDTSSSRELPDERFKGSNQFFYDADVTLHLLNESAYNPNSQRVWTSDEFFNTVMPSNTDREKYYTWPIVDLYVSKNKISEHRQKTIAMAALPPQSKYREIV